jgi:hypothetical protein
MVDKDNLNPVVVSWVNVYLRVRPILHKSAGLLIKQNILVFKSALV